MTKNNHIPVGYARCHDHILSIAEWGKDTNFLVSPDISDILEDPENDSIKAMELQIQCPSDFYGHEEDCTSLVQYWKTNGIEDVSMHFPFMNIDDEGFSFMNLVVPSQAQCPKTHKLDPKVIKDMIDWAASPEVGIHTGTLHVTRPGVRFTQEEWEEYKNIINEMNAYAQDKDFSISIETGGATLDQIIELLKNNPGLRVTNDIVHAYNDGIDPVELYEKCKKLDPFATNKFHVCQSEIGKDLHLRLNQGDSTYLDLIEKISAKVVEDIFALEGRYKPHMIIESLAYPSEEKDANLGILTEIMKPLLKNEKIIIVLNGLPSSGKSTLAGYLHNYFKETNFTSVVYESDELRKEKFPDQVKRMAGGEWVPREERDQVYMMMLQEAERSFEEGTDIVMLDATFNRAENRQSVFDYAKDNGYNVFFIETVCSDRPTVEYRLENRKKYPAVSIETYDSLEAESKNVNLAAEITKGSKVSYMKYDSYRNDTEILVQHTKKDGFARLIAYMVSLYAKPIDNAGKHQ